MIVFRATLSRPVRFGPGWGFGEAQCMKHRLIPLPSARAEKEGAPRPLRAEELGEELLLVIFCVQFRCNRRQRAE